MTDVTGQAAMGGPGRLTLMALNPEITRDMLALGVVLSAMADGELDSSMPIELVSRMAFPRSIVEPDDPRLCYAALVIEADSRRYRTPDPTGQCTAPMTRRPGPCGKRATMSGQVTDWSTGETYQAEACGRHGNWFWRTVDRNRQGPDVGSVPIPPSNSGGLLRIYFPEFNWEALWAELDPHWKPHPEPDAADAADSGGALQLVSANPEPGSRHGGSSPPLLLVSDNDRSAHDE